MKFEVVVQSGAAGSPLIDVIADRAQSAGWDRVSAAVAYATVPGLEAVREVFAGAGGRWLIGLSDAFTHPQVLRRLEADAGAELRVPRATAASSGRFHPKVFLFESSSGTAAGLLIGSANLTGAALGASDGRVNAEAVSLLTAGDATEIASLIAAWQSLWNLGIAPSVAQLASYEANYRPPRFSQTGASSAGGASPPPAGFSLEPEFATVCWIDAGSTGTKSGMEVEWQKDQRRFFGIPRRQGSGRTYRVRFPNGTTHDITLKYRTDNAMLRIAFTSAHPLPPGGLKPGGARSPYAVLLVRESVPGVAFSIEFPKQRTPVYAAIENRSQTDGVLRETTPNRPGSRRYGWW